MSIRNLTLASTLLICGLSFAQAPASGSVSMPRAEQRQINQEKRIEQGAASGQLTQKETARLEKREAKVNADIAAAKADGQVTKAERRKIHAEQDANSRAIAREKHNRKVAPGSAARTGS